MRNVTISMDDALYRETRIRAAEHQQSISRYIADRLRQVEPPLHPGGRNPQLDAIEEFLSGPILHVMKEGMPRAEDRNERGWQRDLR